MKKLTLLTVVVSISLFVFGQSQRLSLIEHFTQASCGYCPAGNTYINNLLGNHPGEVIILRYQVSWPGYDPMNEHNPVQVRDRVNYYNVTGVPNTVFEGNILNGYYGNLTDAMIVDRYDDVSSFQIDLSHIISYDLDSIYITMNIIATRNYSGTLKAHIAVIERYIQFDTPPGNNGERDFYNVMKRMLPTSAGTDLPSSFAIGDTIKIETAWALENVYNMNELAVIGFIQNTGSKQMMQSALSDKYALTADYDYDLAINSATNIPNSVCGNEATLSPIITFKNLGSVSLTTIEFNYSVNDSEAESYIWTGDMPYTVSKTIQLPAFSFAISEENVLRIYAKTLNDIEDEYHFNDTIITPINKSALTTHKIYIEIKTDDMPFQTFWKVINPENPSVALFHGGPYSSSQTYTVIYDTIDLDSEGCYQFIIQDFNGLAEGSYYKLTDDSGLLIWEGGTFTGKDIIPFEVAATSVSSIKHDLCKLSVFPNPALNELNLEFESQTSEMINIVVYNEIGEIVIQKQALAITGNNLFQINTSVISNGIYFIKLANSHEQVYQKIIVTH